MDTKKILLATAIAASLALTACGDGVDEEVGADTAAVDEIGADTGAFDDTLADDPLAGDAMGEEVAGETLALVTAVDEHEIAMAEQARGMGLDGEVAEYADMIHADHTANLEKDRDVASRIGITPTETDEVAELKEEGKAVMDRLAGLEGEAYSDAFLQAMVEAHTEALDMLDERMAGITQPELQQHLTATRDVIAGHLERGEALMGDGADVAPSIAN